ncbi:MAG: SPASM domain-containing protein [Bacteroidetes bacterium]|uniref:SPASM domain-containing protein n=1 Tax=Candidatus Merdivivens pullistercoris TaxID=2840873 RepID=A0A9D9N9P2_9BACT|nr:SPASM domain-containing protein [Candidatus Merdivivens pullistercoris]
MIVSKYTFLFDNNNNTDYYAYNTLSNALIEIDKESYDILVYSENSKIEIELSSMDHELWNALYENNIITENDDDDFLKYKASIARMRTQTASMHLTLAPTMDCCFHCHYCFEKYKTKSYMSAEVMDSIIKYVTTKHDLKNIHITWFGGEPLMAISQIELFHDKFSGAWKNTVLSNIITTGYHIDENTMRVLKKVGISQMQITLDGMKDTHNKVKHIESEEDVFERVMSNIMLLNDRIPDMNIVVRVNLTRENAHEYEQLYKLCQTRFRGRKNIALAPAFVLDRGTSECSSGQTINFFQHKDRSEFILDLASKGMDSPYVHYPEPFFNECAIRNNTAISFDPDGYAYKCWEVIGNKEYAIGRLNKDGILTEINEKILNRQLYGADPIDDATCQTCKYLPLCSGGCPIQRIENKFERKHNCNCTPYKGFLPDFLKFHIAYMKGKK